MSIVKLADGRVLSCEMAYNILQNRVHRFNTRYEKFGCCFLLRDNMSVKDGTTHDENGKLSAVVGMREIPKHEHRPVDAYDFTSALVGFFHESQHVNHVVNIFNRNDVDAQCLAVNYYACMAAPNAYYHGNYHINPREVDAQRAGLLNAYRYCNSVFGEQEAEHLICGYVNERIVRNSEFIEYKDDKPYQNFDDIVDAFDEAFQNAKHCHRTYNPDDAKVVCQKIDGSQEVLPDDSVKFFDKIEKSKSLKSIREQLDNRSGYEQDRILATAYFTEHPEMRHLQDEYVTLQKADLTVAGLCKSFSIPMSVKDKFQKRRDPAVVFDDVLSAVDYDVSNDADYGDE